MPYVEGQTVHDADSHIMELPGTINRYLDPKFRDAFVEKTGRKDVLPEWFALCAWVFLIGSSPMAIRNFYWRNMAWTPMASTTG